MKLVVLFSGGRDSTCLLHRFADDVVCALHVNYGLRGAESDADEAHCRAVCARLGIELVVHRAGVPEGNVQAWARSVRYSVAERLAVERDALIAVGHTATDQAETVLYRLLTSPGRRALLGMPERSGRVLRPLLAMTRSETADYCRAHGLSWREDASNETSARGVLRAALALHPAAERNVLETLAVLRHEAAVLDDLVDAALGEARGGAGQAGEGGAGRAGEGARRGEGGAGHAGEGAGGGEGGAGRPGEGARRGEGRAGRPEEEGVSADLTGAQAGGQTPSGEPGESAAPGEAAPAGRHGGVVGEVRRDGCGIRNEPGSPALEGGRAVEVSRARQVSPDEIGSPRPGVDLSRLPPALARLVLQRLADEAGGPSIAAHADAILALPTTGTATRDLPGGLRAISEYGRVRIDHGPPQSPTPTRLNVPGRAQFGAGELTCERGDFPLADGTLAAHALAPTLEVRAWRQGDRMRPLGLDGTKSLQDLFTDRKIPRERRSQLPIVLSGGEIAWVPGVATGERFKVGDDSGPRVRLSWRLDSAAP